MGEQAPRQPMTDGEREILFQIQQLQAKWFDTIEMCFQRELTRYERVEQVRQEAKDFAAKTQAATLSQIEEFREECMTGLAYCQAELLRHVRTIGGLTRAVELLTMEMKELREQLKKDRLF